MTEETIKNIHTDYYGIYRVYDVVSGEWWIAETGNGADEYFGDKRPTNLDIENFRNSIVSY